MLHLKSHCTIQIKDFTLKQCYVENGIHVIWRPTHSATPLLAIQLPDLCQCVRCNLGANYEQNSSVYNVMCLKLVSQSKHECDAVIQPPRWSYIVQKLK